MTTSYERLLEECNKRLPERLELKFGCEVEHRSTNPRVVRLAERLPGYPERWRTSPSLMYPFSRHEIEHYGSKILGTPLTITDVLRVLAATRPKATSFYIEDDGNLWQCTAPLGDNLLCKFTLSLPLSAAENEAACEAVLDLLTNN